VLALQACGGTCAVYTERFTTSRDRAGITTVSTTGNGVVSQAKSATNVKALITCKTAGALYTDGFTVFIAGTEDAGWTTVDDAVRGPTQAITFIVFLVTAQAAHFSITGWISIIIVIAGVTPVTAVVVVKIGNTDVIAPVMVCCAVACMRVQVATFVQRALVICSTASPTFTC
jgi:hypothetical protein